MNEKDYFNKLRKSHIPDYCRGCELWLKNEKQRKKMKDEINKTMKRLYIANENLKDDK